MPLIKSISGIRGTIGGKIGDNLTPQDIVECTAAFGHWTINKTGNKKIVIGRDARISGQMVHALVVNTLVALGIDIIDLGLSTTPTVEIAVVEESAGAGIILTASHNPKEWNALKFLNYKGEFISKAEGQAVLDIIATGNIEYAPIDKLGTIISKEDYIYRHIEKILEMPLVDVGAIRNKEFKIVVDAVNSTGAIAIPALLEQLGCEVLLINGEMTGRFAHNPEPLPENLLSLSNKVTSERAALGVAIDPDVDRLALVCEDGEVFGEEYTLVAVSDYVLSKTPGATVSNLSSTQALRVVTEKYGQTYHASAVGEVNVVEKMKAVNAVIGGEGNGGVIVPSLHYGRDALAGLALFLSHLANYGKPASFLRRTYPRFVIQKNKIELSPELDVDGLLQKLHDKYKREKINIIDGLKIELDSGDWIHLRKSNTEPIVRIYTESTSEVIARNLANKIKADINEMLKD